jgi:phosphoribosylformylglycinamidine cyclo-ligase
VLGAEPLFFLDYLGTGKLEPHVFNEIIKGFAKACAENNCALIGGETAQMPGFYQAGEYDVSGTIVGVVEKSRMLDGKSIKRGDALIGIASSGLHTNGYSLDRVPELNNTIGDELLKVHVSYGPLVQKLLKKFNVRATRGVKGLAHITGGGFIDNIPRVLPKNCDVVIRKNSWDMLPIFRLLQKNGAVEEQELYQVFNMGIGMVVIADAAKADAMLRFIKAQKHPAWTIGEVTKGTGKSRVR